MFIVQFVITVAGFIASILSKSKFFSLLSGIMLLSISTHWIDSTMGKLIGVIAFFICVLISLGYSFQKPMDQKFFDFSFRLAAIISALGILLRVLHLPFAATLGLLSIIPFICILIAAQKGLREKAEFGIMVVIAAELLTTFLIVALGIL